MFKNLVLLYSIAWVLVTLPSAGLSAQDRPLNVQDTLKQVDTQNPNEPDTSTHRRVGILQPQYYANEGVALGIIFPYHTLGGDFDGHSGLYSDRDFFELPEVTGAYGWGVLVGIRFPEGALELSYLTSTHDITFLEAKRKAHYNVINLDFKFYFEAEKPIQPYCLFGLGFPWLIVKGGHTSFDSQGRTYTHDDAMFASALAFGGGGGVCFHLNPAVSLDAEISYRWMLFGTVNGIDIGKEVDLTGSGPVLSIRATFTLWPLF